MKRTSSQKHNQKDNQTKLSQIFN